MTVHLSTAKKYIVSFPYPRKALRAMKLAGKDKFLPINECPYRFSAANSLNHLRTVSQRVCLTLNNLPLQMWSNVVVEATYPQIENESVHSLTYTHRC
jgi:hypothetical protein